MTMNFAVRSTKKCQIIGLQQYLSIQTGKKIQQKTMIDSKISKKLQNMYVTQVCQFDPITYRRGKLSPPIFCQEKQFDSSVIYHLSPHGIPQLDLKTIMLMASKLE